MEYKYKNIAVSSGYTGVGASTLAKKLAEKLGWNYFGGGDFMRAYAIEQGTFDNSSSKHHDSSAYSDDFDRQVDYQIRKKMQESENNIVDADLSGFMSQGVAGVLKVVLYCSDETVRIERVANRDNLNVMEAKAHMLEKEGNNLTKWTRMYDKEWQEWVTAKYPELASRKIDFWCSEIYDLVIDTYKLGPGETMEAVMDILIDNN